MDAGQLRRDITPRLATLAWLGLVDGLLRLCTLNEAAIARCDEAERAIGLLFDGLQPGAVAGPA
jgi:hypothetical protein